MAVLIDTNVLLRLTQRIHPSTDAAKRALRVLRANREKLYITQQNLVEFWAVATRPISANGLGLTIEQAASELDALKRLFTLLPEFPLQEAWERIVLDHGVAGKNTHDARLVAAMVVHGVESILTFNAQDFQRFSEIRVLDVAKIG